MTIYKVRHKITGQFSTGGMDPRFRVKGGKVWKALNHVRCHLAQFKPSAMCGHAAKHYPDYLSIVELVEYSLVDAGERVIPL